MAKRILKHLAGPLSMLMIAGCTGDFDMQGVSPVDYYAANPIKNKVVYETDSHKAKFASKSAWIVRDDLDRMRDEMDHRSMGAAQSVVVEFNKRDMDNAARRASITKLLRNLGYTKSNVSFQESQMLSADQIKINITYAVVIPPNCPDWRTSPVTSYSNTWQGNFYCASETNLGLMVEDPNDLVKGSVDMPPESSERAAKVVQDYRAGKDFSGASAAGGSSAGSSTSPDSAVASGVSNLSGGGQ
jgi:pilus biogenesis lipoprotein CpaD